MFDTTFAVIENEEQRSELEIFYSENYKRFEYIAMQKVNKTEDAEDVIQEVFSDIADKPEIFFNVPKAERVTFVDILVRNTAIGTFKKERNRTDRLEELDEEMIDESIQIENDMLTKSTREELIKYVLTLPEKQRTVFKLRVITGLSISDIAKQFGISCNTVKWHLKMARRNIKNFIDKGENGNE